jgi:hypothetical protein
VDGRRTGHPAQVVDETICTGAWHLRFTARAERKDVAIICDLDRNDQRRAESAQAWRRHSGQTRAREAAYQRLTTRQQTAERQRRRDRGHGIEP